MSPNPSCPRTEAEGDKQPTVVVTRGHAEEAGVEWDVPVPQALPDGDRVEREIEQDGEDGVGEGRKPQRDAQPVRHEHRGGDDHGPGKRDRHGDRTQLDEEPLVIGVGAENLDVALLEKKAERDGGEQLDETLAAPRAVGESR